MVVPKNDAKLLNIKSFVENFIYNLLLKKLHTQRCSDVEFNKSVFCVIKTTYDS